MPLSIGTLANGGPVHWASGSVTTFGKPVENTTSKPKHCPGYVKPPRTGPAPTEPTLVKFSGTTTADTGDGIKIPGKFKGETCISTAGSFSAPKA